MAESLTCPTCGARNRVGTPAPDTVTCGRCGRALTGSSSSSGSGVAPPPRSRQRPKTEPDAAPDAAAGSGGRAVSSGDAAPPAPKRRRRGAAPDQGSGAGPDTAVLGAPGKAAAAGAAGPVTVAAPAGGGSLAPARARSGDHPGVSRALRILAWVVALPIALVVVGIPARTAGYLNSQRLLDVIVKHDIGRFVPLLVIVALWALVTAVLVTVFIEGARRLSHARGRGDTGPAAPVAGGARTRRGG